MCLLLSFADIFFLPPLVRGGGKTVGCDGGVVLDIEKALRLPLSFTRLNARSTAPLTRGAKSFRDRAKNRAIFGIFAKEKTHMFSVRENAGTPLCGVHSTE